MLKYESVKNIINHKTGVINDPLGQPIVPAGSDCRWFLKFCAGRPDGRTTCVKIVITTGRDCGRPRGSTDECGFPLMIVFYTPLRLTNAYNTGVINDPFG